MINLIFIITLIYIPLIAQAQSIRVDFRPRPPEMIIVKEKNYSGPLVEISRKMAKDNGFTLLERHNDFGHSLINLKKGQLDILPRTFCTQQRLNSIDYLGPIGYQEKVITFIVRKGDEQKIKTYEDLKGLKIGIKRGASYFDQFDSDKTLQKIESKDDKNMIQMLIHKRFDTMAVQDQEASEQAIKDENLTGDISEAEFHYFKRTWNYFGIKKNFEYADKLQATLNQLIKSGYVEQAYRRFSIEAPLLPKDGVLPTCSEVVSKASPDIS